MKLKTEGKRFSFPTRLQDIPNTRQNSQMKNQFLFVLFLFLFFVFNNLRVYRKNEQIILLMNKFRQRKKFLNSYSFSANKKQSTKRTNQSKSKSGTDLDEEPPEKATRTLSEGVIMALAVTACRNFPNRLLRKQSPQNLAASPAPARGIGGLALHLKQRPSAIGSVCSDGGSSCCSVLWQLDWQVEALHAIVED